jgi:gliding motility-associated-like protein
MKYFKTEIFCIAFIFIATSDVISQSENCSGAVTVPIMPNCSSPVAGATGSSQNIPGCVGNADDDVWYQFTATSTSHQITVVPSAGLDPVVQLFSGPCNLLTTISCMDNTNMGQTETIYANNLTIGATYRVRIYHYFTGGGSPNTFTICITTPPPPPANDNCSAATALTVNSSCIYSNATSLNASQSLAGCTGTADDDVWFSFVATSSVHTITVDPSAGMDAVVQLYSGNCGNLTSITCMDNAFLNGNEIINAVGLTAGNTYYIRVYDYYSNTGGAPFQICVTGSTPPVPPNDNPCGAIQLPAVTSACNYLNFSTVGATTTTGVPVPSSCAGGSAPQQGGFHNSPAPKDVWFAITVPATGNLTITAQPGYGINDVAMALYSGTCTSLTQIACSDDYNYPGTANDLKPFLNLTGLTPGTTVYLRYWAYNGSTTGNIGFCVTTNVNDNCANALYICDLNGYSGTTSAAYTIDRPCNMRGLAEMNNPPTYTYTPGTCQGGIFGLGGSWGVGAPACDVRIDNNSWIRFTAANTTATLTVSITNCFVGNYPSGGIQMQIFSAASACCNFTPVSDFKEGSSTLTITANNLTIGQDYYLMIDGYAGDICSYSITASGGVQFTSITATADTICYGQSVTLFGPNGGTAYEWQPGGNTTQNLTVTPSTTTTYSLDVYGVCGNRQTLTKTIYVRPLPTINTNNPVSVCTGQTLNLNAGGGSVYSWTGPNSFTSNLQNPAIPNVSAIHAGVYNVNVTDIYGCSNTATVNVTVNPLPSVNASSNSPVCTGNTLNLQCTGNNLVSFSWTGPNSFSSTQQNPAISNVSSVNTGVYTVTATNSNGCQNTAQTSVVINPLPTGSALNNGPVCVGSTLNLSANGGVSYSWTGPNSFSSTQQNPVIASVTMANAGVYTVIITDANGCSNSFTTNVQVVNNPAVNITATPSNSICIGQSVTLTSTSGSAYNWNTGQNTQQIVVSPTANTTYTVQVTNPGGCNGTANASINITVNSLPVITVTGNTTVCEGDNLQFSANGGAGYSWTGPNNFVSTQATNQINNITLNASGQYTVVGTDANGCSNTANYNVTVNQAPVISNVFASPGSICIGQSSVINAVVSGANSIQVYTQSTGGTPIGTVPLTVSPLSTTTYYIEATSADGCINLGGRYPVTIVVNPLPLVDAGSDQTVCPYTVINLTATTNAIQPAYLWSNSANTQTISVSTGNTNTSYTVTVTDINGCSNSDMVTLFINNTTLLLDAADDTLNITVTNALNPPSGSVDVILNDAGNHNNSVSILNNPANGTFTLNGTNLTYTPNNGFYGTEVILYTICDSTCPAYCDTAQIVIRIINETELVIPSGFSPNDDGVNDEFVILGIERYPENEIYIYNRWGDLVFSAKPYTNDWKGQNNNKKLLITGTNVVDGTYFYVLILNDENNTKKNGFIELRRK